MNSKPKRNEHMPKGTYERLFIQGSLDHRVNKHGYVEVIDAENHRLGCALTLYQAWWNLKQKRS